MSKLITQYRVFIGSPGGLSEERRRFRSVLEKCSAHYGYEKEVMFHPVGWEDTIGGVGRPQAQINEDLKQCDYAVFVLHDRWGSPTGTGHTSGTGEEWALAEELYRANKIRNIALFFRRIDAGKLSDPGDQLKPVLEFKKSIEEGKRFLFKQYETLDEFADTLDGHLARWLKDHESAKRGLLASDPTTVGLAVKKGAVASPGFEFWIEEAGRLFEESVPDHAGALFCSCKAFKAASSDMEWARARNSWGIAQFHLGKPDEAIVAFSEIVDKFLASFDPDRRSLCCTALINKGLTLNKLGRSEQEIAVYDEVVARFGAANESSLREQVARALVSKGVTLGELGYSEEEITVYDEIIARFVSASETALREQVARALVNKGITFGELGRSEEEVAVYNDVVARFGAATETALREQVARALVGKGVTFGELGRNDEAIIVYDEMIARFGAATEISMREKVAMTLVNKGFRLGALGRSEEEIAVYDEVITRFGVANEIPLREKVAMALVSKGDTLAQFGRNKEAIVLYDEVIARFGTANETPLREQVNRAQQNRVGISEVPTIP